MICCVYYGLYIKWQEGMSDDEGGRDDIVSVNVDSILIWWRVAICLCGMREGFSRNRRGSPGIGIYPGCIVLARRAGRS